MSDATGRLILPQGEVLFADDFAYGLGKWRHEGIGRLEIVAHEQANRHALGRALRIDCTGSQQGGAGCHAFCVEDFPDGIALEYDLFVHERNGLFITFIAMCGLRGEDMFSLPPRSGVFKDYTGEDALLRSYHVSVSRYDDEGAHTGVSNWRRNPGLHLVGQGPDLCKEIGRQYRMTIVKDGPHLQLGVDGTLAHEFVDPQELPDRLPEGGKFGFRAIGSKMIAEVSRVRVRKLRR